MLRTCKSPLLSSSGTAPDHDNLSLASHSTGRGGAANLTTVPEPVLEHHTHPHQEYESTGRGGAGNIVHET